MFLGGESRNSNLALKFYVVSYSVGDKISVPLPTPVDPPVQNRDCPSKVVIFMVDRGQLSFSYVSTVPGLPWKGTYIVLGIQVTVTWRITCISLCLSSCM
jgi:hypothetical protein